MTMVYTQRIFWHQYSTGDKLDRLLEFWSTRREICDEISFFTESDGADLRFVPIDEAGRRAAHLKWAVDRALAAGFAVAVNILNTIGHTSDGGPTAPRAPWRSLVGANGVVADYCSCPADPAFLDYTREKHRLFGATAAGRFWIDDDVRLINHRPADWGCFCDDCVSDFLADLGDPSLAATREAVVAAVRGDRTVRAAWVRRNADTIDRVLAACAEGLAEARFEGEIGFMTSGTLLDCGADLPRWFKTLSENPHDLWVRPGGGFWDEDVPLAMLEKLHIGSMTRELVPSARATYEVENYPYTLGQKSTSITGVETLIAHAAVRLDGVMFDIVDQVGNPLASYAEWVDRLRAWVPLWNRASALLSPTRLRGWSTPLSTSHVSQVDGELSNLDLDPRLPSIALQRAGLPLSPTIEGSVGTILDGVAARGMSASELSTLLDRPLIMDGAAASIFVSLGLGERIGVAALSAHGEGVFEVFTSHELNGEWDGFRRAATLNYFLETSYALQSAEGAESLSELTDFTGNVLGSAFLVSQQANSAPVAVIGHFPWSLLNSAARSHQLNALVNRMAPSMPAVAARGGAQLCCWWREGADSEYLVLFNPSFDDVDVRLSAVAEVAFSTHEATEALVGGGKTTLTLPGFGVCGVHLRT